MKAKFADVAVEYRAPGDSTAETLWVPFQLLADCEGKKDEPVHIEATGKSHVTAQWRDGSVPQIVRYDAKRLPMPTSSPPARDVRREPAGTCCGPGRRRGILRPGSVRYALGNIQLRSRGQHRRNGRPTASGAVRIRFPVGGPPDPAKQGFSSAGIAARPAGAVGKSGDWVAFHVGPWAIWLAINKDGRFPDLVATFLGPPMRRPAAGSRRRC